MSNTINIEEWRKSRALKIIDEAILEKSLDLKIIEAARKEPVSLRELEQLANDLIMELECSREVSANLHFAGLGRGDGHVKR